MKIFVINHYDETIGFFSTRKLAEEALELRVSREKARGYYGKENSDRELSWVNGCLGFVRQMGLNPVEKWRPVAETIDEEELDYVPWACDE